MSMFGDDGLPPSTSNGSGGLRDRQRAATRTAIIEAFLDLAHSENAVTISVPAVATKAGVSVRTVYRHFPTKDDLQTAAALHYSRKAEQAMGPPGEQTPDLEAYLRQLWTTLADELPAVLAEHGTPAGRKLRATRLPKARDLIRAGLPAVANDDEAVDLILAVTSSAMFLELVDRMGHTPDRAATLVIDLANRIVADATAKENST